MGGRGGAATIKVSFRGSRFSRDRRIDAERMGCKEHRGGNARIKTRKGSILSILKPKTVYQGTKESCAH